MSQTRTVVVILIVVFSITCGIYLVFIPRPSVGQRVLHAKNPHVGSERLRKRCSFELFKKVASDDKDGVVNGRGSWSRDKKGKIEHFNSVICKLSHGARIPKAKLNTCFKKNPNLRHIVIMGDSNGRRYMQNLHALLKSAMTCSDISSHWQLSYRNYTSRSVVVKRKCRCGGFCTFQTKVPNRRLLQGKCSSVMTGKHTMSINVEYVPLFFWDRSDTELALGCSENATVPFVKSKASTQDYLFQEYMTNPMPDVIILCATMHDRNRLDNIAYIEHQFELLEHFVLSNTTRVILVPFHMVNLYRMPNQWAVKTYYDQSGQLIDRAEWIRQFNVILYRLAKQRFASRHNLLLIPNLAEVSRSILHLNTDGVHMTDDWYRNIMSAILQLLCGI